MIRIVGTGPIALALPGLLLRQGIDPAQISIDRPADSVPEALARRTIALSLGSWQVLSRIIEPPPAASIDEVEISLQGWSGRLRLRAAELGLPALGRVLRYGELHRALVASPAMREIAGAARNVDAPSPAQVTVIADGDPGADSLGLDFGQSAILATVRTDGLAVGVARERFTSDGPLALLPLPESGRGTLVWCLPDAIARERSSLAREAFAAELRRAFGPLGASLEPIDTPMVAPLRRRLRRSITRDSEVAIGNAAQSLHPVAGQGMNLGLRDAFVLAQCLGDALAGGRAPEAALPLYARARRDDRRITVAATDALARIFTWPVLHPAESIALGLLDLIPPARRAIARFFMFGAPTGFR